MLNTVNRSSVFLLLCFVINIFTVPSLTALAADAGSVSSVLTSDDPGSTFAGLCPNGSPYRIFSYQLDIDGLTQSFYDYEGPAGKGTIRTGIPSEKMVVRVCHENADLREGPNVD